MRRTLAALSTVAAVALAACGGSSPRVAAPATPPALIPRAVLFGNPERGFPTLSPDGRHLAFMQPVAGVTNVFVAPVGDLAQATQVTFDETRPVTSYDRSADSRYVLYQQHRAGDENFHIYRVGLDGKDAIDLTAREKIRAELLSVSRKKPGTIMVGVNERNPELHDVYEVDLATGRWTLALENPGYIGFVIDDDQRVRIAQTMEPDGG
jgi:Tol biopolymer transport system component